MLVMQRFQVLDNTGADANDSTPEVWVYDFVTGDMRLIAANAYRGRWVAAGD
jgi:hypothetical protein